jgi:hypothetical protein
MATQVTVQFAGKIAQLVKLIALPSVLTPLMVAPTQSRALQ